ncbi:MAG: undecaprenyldiphospho-muramoylpentapeptide beta-N-acetylglucosaminyltransferase [Bacteroidota bacterium]
MQKRNLKVIISGGGTGGHVFPAIAIANKLKERVENIDILFVGAQGKIEMEKVPAAGYPIEGLWISGFQRKLTTRNLMFPIKLISSMLKSIKIVRRFKPDLVVGVGGFASGPLMRAAISKGVPAVIQEQNSFPGVTNRILANKVEKICVAYDKMERFFPHEKIVFTGNPIRSEILNVPTSKDEASKFFDLKTYKKTILVVGGSLGAGTINRSIEKYLPLLIENNLQLIWQTGKTNFTQAKEAVEKVNCPDIKVFDFINRMDLAYAMADIIVSRAGAIAVSELCCVGKPVILIPSPNVAEDHQTKNAKALLEKEAIIMIKDVEAIETLGEELINLSKNEELQAKMKVNISTLAVRDASDRIVDEILKIVK